MRLWYPLNDTPLLTLPGLSLVSYYWALRSFRSKLTAFIVPGLGIGLWCLILVLLPLQNPQLHQAVTGAVSKFILGLMAFMFFGAIAMPVMMAFRKEYPVRVTHVLYTEWAKFYTGHGKGGGGRAFFFQDLKAVQLEPAQFQGVSFYVVKLIFKPSLNTLWKDFSTSFGLELACREDLLPLIEFFYRRGIEITDGHGQPLK